MEGSPPILVTGAHRSGTTWVGRGLAVGRRVAYVSEPLNVLHRPGVFAAKTRHWYTYICADNETEYLEAFEKLLSFRYQLPAELLSLRTFHDFFRMFRDLGIFAGGYLGQKRALLKDPFAVFSIPWFARRLQCCVVVSVRHPAGFVSSLKRLGWTFDFQDLLDQPLLMRDQLEAFRAPMLRAGAAGIVEKASLLWRIIYDMLDRVRNSQPAVHFVRHEDLSLDPIGGFERLYRECSLEFDAGARTAIRNMSSSKNPSELPAGKAHSVRLDSRSNLETWRHRLSADELAVVRAATEDVAIRYYPDVKWN